MKKLLLLLLLCGFICSVVNADNFDFRQVNWGMDRETVAQTENGLKTIKRINFKAVPKENLSYETELLGYKINLQYEFNPGLIQAYYIFTDSPELKEIVPADPFKYYTDQYIKIKSALSQKYGQPEEVEIWADESFKNMPVSLGKHITLGHLTLKCVWEIERTVIELHCLELLKEYGFFRNRIIYYDREYYRALKEQTSVPVEGLEGL